jgi:hypothetical protein
MKKQHRTTGAELPTSKRKRQKNLTLRPPRIYASIILGWRGTPPSLSVEQLLGLKRPFHRHKPAEPPPSDSLRSPIGAGFSLSCRSATFVKRKDCPDFGRLSVLCGGSVGRLRRRDNGLRSRYKTSAFFLRSLSDGRRGSHETGTGEPCRTT